LSAFAARRTLNVGRTEKSVSGEEPLSYGTELQDISTQITAESALNSDGATRGSHVISSATQISNLEIEIEESEDGHQNLQSDGSHDSSYVVHISSWKT